MLAEPDPPSSVLRRAYALGAFAIRGQADYLVDDLGDGRWRWREPGYAIDLPAPAMAAPSQRDNAAAAIAALRALDLPIDDAAIVAGVAARGGGRRQCQRDFSRLEFGVRRGGRIQRNAGRALVRRIRALQQHRQEDHRQRHEHRGADQALFQGGFHRSFASGRKGCEL